MLLKRVVRDQIDDKIDRIGIAIYPNLKKVQQKKIIRSLEGQRTQLKSKDEIVSTRFDTRGFEKLKRQYKKDHKKRGIK